MNSKIFAGEKEKIESLQVLSVNKIKKNGLIDYLAEREISFSIAQKYLQEIHYKPTDSLKSYYAL